MHTRWMIDPNPELPLAVIENTPEGMGVCEVEGNDMSAARLIAVAPEMLEALKELYEHCSMIHNIWGEGCNRKQADAAIKKGRAAITKAEGGAK